MSNIKPKVIAYCPLHYGQEYLDVAIRAIDPFVEKIVILYSDQPSYGFNTSLKNPDVASTMAQIAHNASSKIQWENILSSAENQHRGYIHKFAQGYDGILAFDADEVFEPADIQIFIDYCHNGNARWYGVDGYINFWKSFNHACYDGFRPIRYENLHKSQGQDLNAKCRIYHFSTAQRMDIMRYKLAIHGHKNEIRENWLKEVYEAWTPENNLQDLHLVARNLWNAVPFDKNIMPNILKSHPNFDKEIII